MHQRRRQKVTFKALLIIIEMILLERTTVAIKPLTWTEKDK